MRVVLHGRHWNLTFVPNLGPNRGVCDSPTTPGKAIKIQSGLKGEELLEVLIHEALHACAWNLDEDAVTVTAEDIARMLWKLGYRRTV